MDGDVGIRERRRILPIDVVFEVALGVLVIGGAALYASHRGSDAEPEVHEDASV